MPSPLSWNLLLFQVLVPIGRFLSNGGHVRMPIVWQSQGELFVDEDGQQIN